MSELCTCHLGRHTWCAIHHWNRDHLTVVQRKPAVDTRAVLDAGGTPPLTPRMGVKRNPNARPPRIATLCVEEYGGHTPGPNDACARCATPRSKW